MDAIKDIRQDLINEIMNLNDLNTLNSLYETIEQSKKESEIAKPIKIDEAITEMKKGWTLDQIVAEQNVNQITYPEITEIVEHISWEVSLEELLANID